MMLLTAIILIYLGGFLFFENKLFNIGKNDEDLEIYSDQIIHAVSAVIALFWPLIILAILLGFFFFRKHLYRFIANSEGKSEEEIRKEFEDD